MPRSIVADPSIPVGFDVPIEDWMIPTAAPVDEDDKPLIPELGGREPTHNESFLISGQVLTAASTNVKEFWWNWQSKDLFVRFLSGDLGRYSDVPLDVAVGFIETMSPGRYVWSELRPFYTWHRIERGPRKGQPGYRKKHKAQVVRIVGPAL